MALWADLLEHNSAKSYLAATLGAAVLVLLLIKRTWRAKYKLPPGPSGVPLLGSLPFMTPLVYRSFAEMAKQYGPIMTVRLGTVPNVIVSNAEMAREVLKTHDHVLASRPKVILAERMFAPGVDMAWAPLGAFWRNIRKLCNTELLSTPRQITFAPIRRDEMNCMLAVMEAGMKGCKLITLRDYLAAATINNMTRMVISKRYEVSVAGKLDGEGQEFKYCVAEAFRLGGSFNIGDFIPALRRLDLQGYEKKLSALRRRMDAVTSDILHEHLKKPGDSEEAQDFVDILLKVKDAYDLNHSLIGNLIWNIVGAGSDTTAGSVEWAIAELLIHPQKLAKAQSEIEEVVGSKQTVEEEDLPKLKYVGWILKESMRLHPPTAMLLPHMSTEHCTIAGYDIPPNTTIHVNAWAVAHDPATWPQPDEFLPERYEEDDVDMRGYDFRLLPFGAGRRVCPGAQIAILSATFLLANLLHRFYWSLPNATKVEDVDMCETFGLVQCMATPIKALISPRHTHDNKL